MATKMKGILAKKQLKLQSIQYTEWFSFTVLELKILSSISICNWSECKEPRVCVVYKTWSPHFMVSCDLIA